MRRRLALALALALAAGGLAACGADGGDGSTGTTTASTTAPTTTTAATPAEAVDAFCAKTDELNALLQEMGAGGQQPNAEQQARLSEVGGEAAQMMMTLQMSTAEMLPGDVARFQECAAVLGGTEGVTEGP